MRHITITHTNSNGKRNSAIFAGFNSYESISDLSNVAKIIEIELDFSRLEQHKHNMTNLNNCSGKNQRTPDSKFHTCGILFPVRCDREIIDTDFNYYNFVPNSAVLNLANKFCFARCTALSLPNFGDFSRFVFVFSITKINPINRTYSKIQNNIFRHIFAARHFGLLYNKVVEIIIFDN